MSIKELEQLTRPHQSVTHARGESNEDILGGYHRYCTCGSSWYGSGPETFVERENHLIEAGVITVGDLAGLSLI